MTNFGGMEHIYGPQITFSSFCDLQAPHIGQNVITSGYSGIQIVIYSEINILCGTEFISGINNVILDISELKTTQK